MTKDEAAPKGGDPMRFTEGDADRLLAHWTPWFQGAVDALEKKAARPMVYAGARVRTAIRHHAPHEIVLHGFAAQTRIEDLAALVRTMLRDVTSSVRAAKTWADLPFEDWLLVLRGAGWWGDRASDIEDSKDSDDWKAAGFMGRFYDAIDIDTSGGSHTHGNYPTVTEYMDAIDKKKRAADDE